MATTTNQAAPTVRHSFALLSGGFRIFFLLGALWAILVLALFGAALGGTISLPAAIDPIAWHRHEMLFGYLGAIVGGFLLTAIPNWTGRKPLTGLPLLGLAFLWATARLAILSSLRVGLPTAILCDAGFLLVMAGVAGAELYAARNRNVPIVLLTVVLAAAAAVDLAEGAGLMAPRGVGYRLGIGVVLIMVMLIGGRIIPTFTRNWLTKSGLEPRLPAPMQRFDLVGVLAGVAAMLAWVVQPDRPATAWLMIGAGALHLARLLRWRGWRTAAEPLLAILHLAYLWVPAGLVLLGTGLLGRFVPVVSGVHALTAGAFATMTLAVMTRASLGHTGRASRRTCHGRHLRADPDRGAGARRGPAPASRLYAQHPCRGRRVDCRLRFVPRRLRPVARAAPRRRQGLTLPWDIPPALHPIAAPTRRSDQPSRGAPRRRGSR